MANHGKGDEQIEPKQIAQEQQTPGILYDTQEEPTEESTPLWSYEAHTTDQTGGFAESVVSEKGIQIGRAHV